MKGLLLYFLRIYLNPRYYVRYMPDINLGFLNYEINDIMMNFQYCLKANLTIFI